VIATLGGWLIESSWRRAVTVFTLLCVLITVTIHFGKEDRIPLSMTPPTLLLLLPGYFLRGIASSSELGFADWRDFPLMTVGSAGFYTSLFAVADWVARRWWRAGSARDVV
jgi:hypothetical protein